MTGSEWRTHNRRQVVTIGKAKYLTGSAEPEVCAVLC